MRKKIIAFLACLPLSLALAGVEINQASEADLDGIKGLGPATTRLILAEPAGADDTARSLAIGERQGAFTPDTICDGLRTLIGAPNFELLRAVGAEVIVVDDASTDDTYGVARAMADRDL